MSERKPWDDAWERLNREDGKSPYKMQFVRGIGEPRYRYDGGGSLQPGTPSPNDDSSVVTADANAEAAAYQAAEDADAAAYAQELKDEEAADFANMGVNALTGGMIAHDFYKKYKAGQAKQAANAQGNAGGDSGDGDNGASGDVSSSSGSSTPDGNPDGNGVLQEEAPSSPTPTGDTAGSSNSSQITADEGADLDLETASQRLGSGGENTGGFWGQLEKGLEGDVEEGDLGDE